MAYDWMPWMWSGCGLAALFVTGVLAAIDYYKYQPALKRKQRDAVWAAIDQLQHDVAELRGALQEKS
jgi:Tfp pilus assembly protein PilE